jgi:hypothetical protein
MIDGVPTATPFSGWVECGAGFGDPHWPGCSALNPGQGYERGIGHAIKTCRERGWAVAHVPAKAGGRAAPKSRAYVDLSRYAYWLENGGDGLEASAGD